MERLTQDGVEVARYAAKRFGKRKVIIMGGSWGSALAVNIIMAAPALFHAMSGRRSWRTMPKIRRLATLACSHWRALGGDADSTNKLELLGPPPWTNPRAFGILRRIGRRYEAERTDPAPPGWFVVAPDYDTPAYRADYTAGEDYSFLNFVGLANNGMGPKIDLFKQGSRFAMPVYLLQGEEDLVTPTAVSQAYFEAISAPKKEFLLLPRTGHDPNQTMIDAQLRVLKRIRTDAMRVDAR